MQDSTYWLSRAPGTQPEGPYYFDQLESMFAGGQVTAQAQICPQGGKEWRLLAEEIRGQETVAWALTGQRTSAGTWLFVLGVICLLIAWPIGLLMLIAGIIVERTTTYQYCGDCGNDVGNHAKVCGSCGSLLKRKSFTKTLAMACVGFVICVVAIPLGISGYFKFIVPAVATEPSTSGIEKATEQMRQKLNSQATE